MRSTEVLDEILRLLRSARAQLQDVTRVVGDRSRSATYLPVVADDLESIDDVLRAVQDKLGEEAL